MRTFLKILPRYKEMMRWKKEMEQELQMEFGASYSITIESLDIMTGIDAISYEVASTLNVTVSHLVGSSRRTHFKEARHIAIYLCKNYLSDITERELADYFQKDRSTISHSITNIQNLLEIGDERICEKVDRCRRSIDAKSKNL